MNSPVLVLLECLTVAAQGLRDTQEDNQLMLCVCVCVCVGGGGGCVRRRGIST